MDGEYVLILSEADPVATAVGALWGTPVASDWHVDGSPIRTLPNGVRLLRRPGWHVEDNHLDRRLPTELRARRPVLVFPSIHRSARGVAALAVHPLGNLGPSNEVGGEPRTVVPTAPRLMTAALRSLAEGGRSLGTPATFEATHHGPALELPSFFAEIGYGELEAPPDEAVRLLARVLSDLSVTEADRVAVGVGGGHYAPHFTDLALKRRWAFGHIVSRHALPLVDRELAEAVLDATPEAEGILYARAEDADCPPWRAIGPRLKDTASETRSIGQASL